MLVKEGKNKEDMGTVSSSNYTFMLIPIERDFEEPNVG